MAAERMESCTWQIDGAIARRVSGPRHKLLQTLSSSFNGSGGAFHLLLNDISNVSATRKTIRLALGMRASTTSDSLVRAERD